jgi:Outer membrane protein beta-barrel domain
MSTYFLKIKGIAVVIGIFCLCFTTNGQISVGVAGGLNLATQQSDLLEFGYAPYLRTGVNLEFRFLKRFSIGYELGYTKKGYQTNTEGVDIFGTPLGKQKFKSGWNYLDNNCLLKYRLSSKKTRSYLLTGFSHGTLISGKEKTFGAKVEGIDYDVYKRKLDLTFWKRNDFALLAGFGIEKHIKNTGFVFSELRYQHGFTNLLNVENPIVYYKHRNISLTIGYAFLFGNKKFENN